MNFQQFHTCLKREKSAQLSKYSCQQLFLLAFLSYEGQKSPGKMKNFHIVEQLRRRERNEKISTHKKGERKRNFRVLSFFFLVVKCEQLSENCIKQLKFYLLMGFLENKTT